MTGFNCSALRHQCERHGCYIAQLPNWDDLIAAFPRAIRPTDIDGMVEINKHFLFLEEKSAGVTLDRGQLRAFKALAQQPNTTVVFFRPHIWSGMEVLTWEDGEPSGWQQRERVWLTDYLHDWAVRADASPAEPWNEDAYLDSAWPNGRPEKVR